MMVLVLERVSKSLRGDLSRWLIEASTGVFVGKVSGAVRDSLWERCLSHAKNGTVLQIWRANTEQGFDLRVHQPKDRRPINIEGVWLMQIPPKGKKCFEEEEGKELAV